MSVADIPPTNTNGKPPRAPLAFRVGVVGHRPDRLDNDKLKELATTMSTILKTVKEETHAVGALSPELYDGLCPVMGAVSPLAEGTDRIFAEQALGLGFNLSAVLPFPKAEFEGDFVPGTALEEGSLARFRGLLDRAKTRFELDGTRVQESEAYGECGLVVLNQSDLLIVVWDGQRLGKRGGTEDTFREARDRGVTVAWIDARQPRNWQLLNGATPLPAVAAGERAVPDGSGSTAGLGGLVRQILELPKLADEIKKEKPGKKNSHGKRIDAGTGLRMFYAEHRPSWSPAVFWKIFVKAIGGGTKPKVSLRLNDFEEAVTAEWPKDRSTPIADLVDRLRPFYAWPDRLAVLYADRYRSAFTFNYLIAAIAVSLALLPLALDLLPESRREIACIALELAAISAILVLVKIGRGRYWHERWIDYRFAAELVRHLRIVAPLGGRRPFPQIPAHWVSYGQPGASWMAWYVRAVERWLGLPDAVVGKTYLDDYLKQLEGLVSGQVEYHKDTAHRCHNMESRLHGCGIVLLSLTFAACGIHLAIGFGIWPEALHPVWLSRWLTFFCGCFPALGAATAAINNQGEFRSLTNRSEAMREQLDLLLNRTISLKDAIAKAPCPAVRQFSAEAVELASGAAGLLVNEVLDWRVVLLDQPLHPPA